MTIHEAFSFGYHGWGNQLVQAIDTVEAAHGWKPPLFVDIRIQRSGRAKGFQRDRFARRVGADRYHWLRGLGNRSVRDKNIEADIVIDEPIAVLELLSRIVRERNRRRRVIFFCHCEYPWSCHRHKVANLLLAAAKANGIRLNVSEWPGGMLRVQRIPRFDLSRKQARSDDAHYLLLSEGMSPKKLQRALSLPWMSIVRVGDDDWQRTIITGPAKFTHRGWALPSFGAQHGQSAKAFKRLIADAHRQRITLGYSAGDETTPIRRQTVR
jgi:hypothetical protein